MGIKVLQIVLERKHGDVRHLCPWSFPLITKNTRSWSSATNVSPPPQVGRWSSAIHAQAGALANLPQSHLSRPAGRRSNFLPQPPFPLSFPYPPPACRRETSGKTPPAALQLPSFSSRSFPPLLPPRRRPSCRQLPLPVLAVVLRRESGCCAMIERRKESDLPRLW